MRGGGACDLSINGVKFVKLIDGHAMNISWFNNISSVIK